MKYTLGIGKDKEKKMRKLAVLLVSLLFVLPLMGYEQIWDGNSEGDIEINLQVDCYIQITWQDTEIDFTDQSPYDYWSTQLMGLGYSACPDDDNKHPMDPWAGDQWYTGGNGRYYESHDGAVIYVHTNNELTMSVQTNGDLTGQVHPAANNTIPTYFTVALAPFMIDDVWLTTGTIPGGGQGSYLYESGLGVFGYNNPSYNYPDQYAFPCAPASQWQLGPMMPETQGTIKFLCRIHRNGMADPGDHYYTSLNVMFTSP